MKITITRTQDSDNGERQKIKIEGGRQWSIFPLCDCPEDAIVGRGLVDADDLVSAIKAGFDAAKNGETLDIVDTN